MTACCRWPNRPCVRVRTVPYSVGTVFDLSLQKLLVDEKRCYLFGRDKDSCDFPLQHQSCSRQHAALVYHKHLNRPFLIDLGSSELILCVVSYVVYSCGCLITTVTIFLQLMELLWELFDWSRLSPHKSQLIPLSVSVPPQEHTPSGNIWSWFLCTQVKFSAPVQRTTTNHLSGGKWRRWRRGGRNSTWTARTWYWCGCKLSVAGHGKGVVA